MTGLDVWLRQATRNLARDSAALVRTEIREHYECARESALSRGATTAEIDRAALAALGDANAANRQYRRVLLTSAEARMLHQGNWEARALCSWPAVKWLLSGIPLAALAAAVAFDAAGESS